MNIVFPQTYEAQAEAMDLMRVDKCILTAQSNRPVMGLVQNGLLGMRQMTSRDVFFTKHQVMQFIMVMEQWDGKIPIPAIHKSRRAKEPLWTGKQVFSMILPNIVNYRKVALFHDETETLADFSTGDTITIIKNGELIAGNVCKRSLGPSQGSIVHVVCKDYGPEATRKLLDECIQLSNCFFDYNPGSIGYKDTITSNNQVRRELVPLLKKARDESMTMIKNGVTRKELEARSNKILNDVRKKLAEQTIKKLPRDNGFRATLTAGSKGSAINPSLMMSAIGQQNVEGARVPDGFDDRPLPHFTKFCYGPLERGFVPENYVTGLSPVSFIFHSMSGREGLTDTAVKTSRSGYIQRKLAKALEDLTPKHDGTVRNERSEVIQFSYGEDGMDASQLETQTVDTFGISTQDLTKMFKWSTDELMDEGCATDQDIQMVLREWQRLLKDQENGKLRKEKSIALPCHLVRLIDSIPRFPESPRMTARKVIDEILQLQSRLWKSLPEGTETWDSPFAMALRCNLSSKNMVKRIKITEEEWKWLIGKIEHKFNLCIVAPGESVGTVAAQSIGEPATQMSVDGREGVVIYHKDKVVFCGPISQFVDNLIHLDQLLGTHRSVWNDESVVLDVSERDYRVDGVMTSRGTKREIMTRQKITEVSRHMANGEMVKITTQTGRTVKCTASHSFLKRSETQEIVPILGRDLQVGHRVPVAKRIELISKSSDTDTHDGTCFGQLIGSYLANLQKYRRNIYTVSLLIRTPSTFHQMELLTLAFPGSAQIKYSKYISFNSRKMIEWMGIHVGNGGNIQQTRVPECLMDPANINMARGFLVESVSQSKSNLSCGGFHIQCINNRVAEEVSLIATRLQVGSTIQEDNTVCFNTGEYIDRILNVINGTSDPLPLGLDDNFCDSIPHIGRLVAECAEELLGINLEEYDCLRTTPELPRTTLASCIKRLLELCPHGSKKLNELDAVLHSDVMWDRIVSVEKFEDPKEFVYDFSVEESNTFMVNSGIVVHNTLNTFHHVGQSEKNMTLGVPRLEEITNCAKNPKTPSMTVRVNHPLNTNKHAVLAIMQRMERLFLKDIVVSEEVYYDPDVGNTIVEADVELVESFFSLPDKPLTEGFKYGQYIVRYTMDTTKMKEHAIKADQVVDFIKDIYSDTVYIEWNDEYCDTCVVRIRPVTEEKVSPGEDALLCIELSKRLLVDMPINGVDHINRTFLQEDKLTKEYFIETDGTNLAHIMGVEGIDWKRTTTNDIHETLRVLGIEACRATMLNEIVTILSFDSGYVNVRHPSLLCDNITHMGTLTSVSRHGINRFDAGPLFKSSFEETVEMLVAAGRFAQIDPVKGPTAHIITGSIPEFGTNSFDVYLDDKKLVNAVPVVMPLPATPAPDTQTTTSYDGIIKRRKFDVLDFDMDITNSDAFDYIPPSPSRLSHVEFDYGAALAT